MKIWKMTNVSGEFHELILKEQSKENYKYLFGKFEGNEIGDEWRPLHVKYIKKRAKYTDAPKCWDIYSPVFSKKAAMELSNYLSNCEKLPLIHDKYEYFAINVLNVVDALNIEHSEIERFPSGGVMNITKYDFNFMRVKDQHIFKIPEKIKLVFVSDQFVQKVKESNLKGFVFQEVWDSEKEA